MNPLTLTKLSVNINKIATLRNARGGNIPDVLEACVRIQQMDADGITVHPRPDQRHIRYDDVRAIGSIMDKEFNIEGNPKESNFIDLVLEVKPTQVTLVPDDVRQITSTFGWNTVTHFEYLQDVVNCLKKEGIRTSIFIDPDKRMLEGAAATGVDRVELYTEMYARIFEQDKEAAIKPYYELALEAERLPISLNAGHDLNATNLSFFCEHIPNLAEVSIGHALISDALYDGLAVTIRRYKKALCVVK